MVRKIAEINTRPTAERDSAAEGIFRELIAPGMSSINRLVHPELFLSLIEVNERVARLIARDPALAKIEIGYPMIDIMDHPPETSSMLGILAVRHHLSAAMDALGGKDDVWEMVFTENGTGITVGETAITTIARAVNSDDAFSRRLYSAVEENEHIAIRVAGDGDLSRVEVVDLESRRVRLGGVAVSNHLGAAKKALSNRRVYEIGYTAHDGDYVTIGELAAITIGQAASGMLRRNAAAGQAGGAFSDMGGLQ